MKSALVLFLSFYVLAGIYCQRRYNHIPRLKIKHQVVKPDSLPMVNDKDQLNIFVQSEPQEPISDLIKTDNNYETIIDIKEEVEFKSKQNSDNLCFLHSRKTSKRTNKIDNQLPKQRKRFLEGSKKMRQCALI